MKREQTYWMEQAADMEKLIQIRSKAINDQVVQEELAESQRRASIMEEWKDKVEEQRQGLEKQVGEIERNRQLLEQKVEESEKKCRSLEQQIGALQAELDQIHNSKGWKFLTALRKVELFLLPPDSLRRKLVSKIRHIFH